MPEAAGFDFGPKPSLAYLPVDVLMVDHRYQRTLESKRSIALIEKMAAAFYWPAFGALLVAPTTAEEAADQYAVVDGQHRLTVARRLGINEVPCIIIAAETVEAQARAFLSANRDRIVVNQFAVYHASVKAGAPRAVAVGDACDASDVEIPKYQVAARFLKPNQTLAIGTIEKMIGMHGVEIVTDALTTLRRAFPQEVSLRAYFIRGFVECFATDHRVKVDTAVQALGKLGFAEFDEAVDLAHGRINGSKWQSAKAVLHDLVFPRLATQQQAEARRSADVLPIRSTSKPPRQGPVSARPFKSIFEMNAATPKKK